MGMDEQEMEMTAFYDDSGQFEPNKKDFASLGMVVTPMRYIRELGDSWYEMLGRHFMYTGSLQASGTRLSTDNSLGITLKETSFNAGTGRSIPEKLLLNLIFIALHRYNGVVHR